MTGPQPHHPGHPPTGPQPGTGPQPVYGAPPGQPYPGTGPQPVYGAQQPGTGPQPGYGAQQPGYGAPPPGHPHPGYGAAQAVPTGPGGWRSPAVLHGVPVGQAGALGGSSWQQRGAVPVPFVRLMAAELRKMFATVSDVVLMAAAPLALIGVTVLFCLTVPAGSFADQVEPLTLGAHLGIIPFAVAVTKVVSGEWHYRSVQLSLLLQPRRAKFLLAQLATLGVFWVLAAVLLFATLLIVRPLGLAGSGSDSYVAERWPTALGLAFLASLLSILFAYAFASLLRNTLAATLGYVLVQLVVTLRFAGADMGGAQLANPYGLVDWLSRNDIPWLAAVTGSVILVGMVVAGMALVSSRDTF